LEAVARPAAVFFDVDFTLIHPGPRFQAVGYHETCARYGIDVDQARFDAAVAAAGSALDSSDELYDARLYIDYTRRIIEGMGGRGPRLTEVAEEIYAEWAHNHHFTLYDDVPDALRALVNRGVRLGLISNSHRCLESFQTHFDIEGLISVTVSSIDHGVLKPSPRIFTTALELMQVRAADAVMVGDSLSQDVAGARRVGMRGILLARGGRDVPADPDVAVIRSLAELPDLLG
jgi:putative hydrolase of the HAD superfamily